ncbi:MAG: hypothetical protein ABI230_12025 [Aestuariivirga sp.]
MNITGKVASIKISDVSNYRDDMHSPGRSQFISMALAANGTNRLELETGEVFATVIGSRRNAPANQIGLSLEIYRSENPSDSAYNRIIYHPKGKGDYYHDSFISATYQLGPEEFSDLIQNIRAKLYPTHVTIGVDWKADGSESPVSYGHDPDGREIQWKNAQQGKNRVGLTSISFLSQPVTQDNSGVIALQPFDDEPEPLSTVLPDPNAAITKALRLTNWLLIAIAVGLFLIIANRH